MVYVLCMSELGQFNTLYWHHHLKEDSVSTQKTEKNKDRFFSYIIFLLFFCALILSHLFRNVK